MNVGKFVEVCRENPALIKGLLFCYVIGDRFGKDIPFGLEVLRQTYEEFSEETNLAMSLLELWTQDEFPDDKVEVNNPLGLKGC